MDPAPVPASEVIPRSRCQVEVLTAGFSTSCIRVNTVNGKKLLIVRMQVGPACVHFL